LPIARIIANSCVNRPRDDVLAAYEAPFPTAAHQAGAKAFPSLVPTSPTDPASDANRQAWQGLMKFEKPFLCCFSDSDPITRGSDVYLRKLIPGTKGQPHVTIRGAGHFLQEEKGMELAQLIIDMSRRLEPWRDALRSRL